MTVEHIREHKEKTDFPAERCLQVNHCGVRRVAGHDHTILRSNGRNDYHFLYIQSGFVTAETDRGSVRVDAGKCLVYKPRVRQLYTFPSEGDPIAYFVYFTGEAAAEAMAFAQSREEILFSISDRTAFEGLFRQLFNIHNQRKPMYVTEENGVLLQLIALLARSGLAKAKAGRSDILFASAYIREHYLETVNLEEYAARMHLSLSRFAHLFTETMGVSPHKFILRLRMDSAKELLLYSSMGVAEVSESTGFADPSYFSRLFRQYTGLSPTDYREKNSQSDG